MSVKNRILGDYRDVRCTSTCVQVNARAMSSLQKDILTKNLPPLPHRTAISRYEVLKGLGVVKVLFNLESCHSKL